MAACPGCLVIIIRLGIFDKLIVFCVRALVVFIADCAVHEGEIQWSVIGLFLWYSSASWCVCVEMIVSGVTGIAQGELGYFRVALRELLSVESVASDEEW